MRRPTFCTFAVDGSALLGAATIVSPAAAGCSTRHMYNHSDDTWTVRLQGGNAACSAAGAASATSCNVPPGQVAELHYPGPGKASIFLQSNHPGSSAATFTVDEQCVIAHSGNTGNVFLNDPASGDVQTCGHRTGGNFDCRY